MNQPNNPPTRKPRRERPLPPIMTLAELNAYLLKKYGPTMRPPPRRRKRGKA